jgi:hypothetical protein
MVSIEDVIRGKTLRSLDCRIRVRGQRTGKVNLVTENSEVSRLDGERTSGPEYHRQNNYRT